MQPTVFVFAFLAASAAASPADVQPRGFPIGGGSVASSTSSQQQSSTEAHNGYSAGPFGYGASSSYRHQSSSSYSSSTVMNTWSGLGGQIGALQSLIAAGGISQQVAMSRMQQIASGFSTALTQAPMCGGCFGQGGFVGGVSNVFSRFYSLLNTVRSTYGAGFVPQVLAPFSGLSRQFQSFFHSASSYKVSYNSIVATGLPGLMNNVIPGFTQMVGFK